MRRAILLMIAAALGACDDMGVQPKQKVYSPLVIPNLKERDSVAVPESATI